MVVLGDVHLTDNWIKRQQVKKFFEWLKKQEFLKKETSIVFLGDLFETPRPYSAEVNVYLNLFINEWSDKSIYILEGNHDCNLQENALNFFSYLSNVKVIKELSEITIDDKKCLFLPHYDHEGTDKLPMCKYYSSLSGTYDYIFAHVMDETQNFGGDFCDLKNIKGQRLFGHVHTPTVQNSGSYLGSVVKNSSTEKDDQKYLAVIGPEKYKLVEIPSFMEYETVTFGEEPKHKDTLVLLNIVDAPTKAEALAFYETKFPEIKCNKVTSKRQRILSTESKDVLTEQDSWNMFCTEKKLDDDVKNICSKLLQN